MTRSQGPSQGPSATASTSTTGEAGGWEWPPWPQPDEPPAPNESPRTTQDVMIKTVPEGTTRHKHGTPGRDMWTRSTGPGLESAAGRRACQMHSRRACQRRDLWEPRTAADISRDRQAWVSHGRRLRSPPIGGPG